MGFIPFILTPEQWRARHHNKLATGELRLMFAILEDAYFTIEKNAPQRTRREKNLFRETIRWFAARGDMRLFSFETICHCLGLDPEWLRGGIFRQFNVSADIASASVRERPQAIPAKALNHEHFDRYCVTCDARREVVRLKTEKTELGIVNLYRCLSCDHEFECVPHKNGMKSRKAA